MRSRTAPWGVVPGVPLEEVLRQAQDTLVGLHFSSCSGTPVCHLIVSRGRIGERMIRASLPSASSVIRPWINGGKRTSPSCANLTLCQYKLRHRATTWHEFCLPWVGWTRIKRYYDISPPTPPTKGCFSGNQGCLLGAWNRVIRRYRTINQWRACISTLKGAKWRQRGPNGL